MTLWVTRRPWSCSFTALWLKTEKSHLRDRSSQHRLKSLPLPFDIFYLAQHFLFYFFHFRFLSWCHVLDYTGFVRLLSAGYTHTYHHTFYSYKSKSASHTQPHRPNVNICVCRPLALHCKTMVIIIIIVYYAEAAENIKHTHTIHAYTIKQLWD